MGDASLHQIPVSANWYLPCGAAMSSDGQYYAYAGNTEVVLFRWEGEGRIARMRSIGGHEGRVNGVHFLPAGQELCCLVSCSQDKSIRLWSAGDQRCLGLHRRHSRPPVTVSCCSLEWGVVISAEEEGTVVIWKLPAAASLSASLEMLEDPGHFQTLQADQFNIKAKISTVQCVPSIASHILIAYQNGVILLVNWRTGQVIHRLLGHTDHVCSLSFSPTTTTSIPYVVSGSKDRTVRFWSLSSGRCLMSIPLDVSKGKARRGPKESWQRFWAAVAWNPYDPLQVAVSSHSGDIHLYRMTFTSPEKPESVEEGEIASSISPVQRFYQSSEEDWGSEVTWDIQKTGASKNGERHTRSVFNLSFQGLSVLLSTSMDRQIGV